MKTRIGIVGYGNLAKAAIDNLKNFKDMELVAIFSRRVLTGLSVQAFTIDELPLFKDKIDVLLMCGGSKEDLPLQSPKCAENFCIVDSFDTHKEVNNHFEKIEKAAKKNHKLALISGGWDPGVFSLARVFFENVLPQGDTHTFWGAGVSQGHSDAVRKVKGVKKAVQYTIPKEEAIEAVKNGENPTLSTREKHARVCYVVCENFKDEQRIEQEIKSMPNYFSDYDTTVNFISEEDFDANHTAMPHGGNVIRSGALGNDSRHVLELSIKLESNPHFTSAVLLAYVRAVKKLYDEGRTGCLTVLDVPFSYLSDKEPKEQRKLFV